MLTVFAGAPDTILSHDDLLDRVWGETFVEESNLRYCVHQIRKNLRADLIETIPKIGYRFTGTVEVVAGDSAEEKKPSDQVKQRSLLGRFWLVDALLCASVVGGLLFSMFSEIGQFQILGLNYKNSFEPSRN